MPTVLAQCHASYTSPAMLVEVQAYVHVACHAVALSPTKHCKAYDSWCRRRSFMSATHEQADANQGRGAPGLSAMHPVTRLFPLEQNTSIAS